MEMDGNVVDFSSNLGTAPRLSDGKILAILWQTIVLSLNNSILELEKRLFELEAATLAVPECPDKERLEASIRAISKALDRLKCWDTYLSSYVHRGNEGNVLQISKLGAPSSLGSS